MKESSVINKHVDPDTSMLSEETPGGSDVKSFSLQPDTKLENSSSYNLSDLLQYHDRAFILNAYTVIAREPPAPGDLEQRLHDLRSGRRTKTEIVEDLVAMHPDVRVKGLSSTTIRGVSRWPVIGYILRVARGLARLPLMIQHQQQFESYIVGQQQRTIDYVNEVLAPPRAIDYVNEVFKPPRAIDFAVSFPREELSESVSDALKTVMMLSDSLIELSANLASIDTQLQRLKAKQENAETEFHASLISATEQLTTHLQRQQEQSTTSIQQLQKQQEQSEAQLHANLVTLTNQLSLQQEVLAELRREQELTTVAQREFLIDEQRAIVEAQKAALSDLQAELLESRRDLQD